jgi:hypothetical protein
MGIVDDDRNFPLEIHVIGFAGQFDVIAGPDEVIRGALTHQRIFLIFVGYPEIEGALHQGAMISESRPVEPLVAARQRRHCLRGIEGEGGRRGTGIELVAARPQRVFHRRPLLQGAQKSGCYVVGEYGVGEVFRNHAQAPVAGAVFDRCKLHDYLVMRGTPSLPNPCPVAFPMRHGQSGDGCPKIGN